MVHKFFPNIKKSEKGVTLIEIIVVILVITLFSLILIADFPKIQKQMALSRVTYKLAQDLRKVQDLSLSGVKLKDSIGNPIAVKGYGIYIDVGNPTKYIIYADIDNTHACNYLNQPCSDSLQLCDAPTADPKLDCALEEPVDISKENINLKISSIVGINNKNFTSINFRPPDPITDIQNFISGRPEIVISLYNGLTYRKISVNKSGLINVVQ